MSLYVSPVSALPEGLSSRAPRAADVDALVALLTGHQNAARGYASVDPGTVRGAVIGPASWTRQQVVVTTDAGQVVAWCTVHDRAAGRTIIDLVVAPSCPEADRVAGTLLEWARSTAKEVAKHRLLEVTQLDAGVFAGDTRLQGWLAAAGYRKTRTWLQMTRPVDDADSMPGPRAGVTVRRVGAHEEGMPIATDLHVVHRMLEESFADHFNSYRESFAEFVQRLREAPGHRWDHWWIAEMERDGQRVPGGTLVASVSPPDETGAEGSYVDYIGVHRSARGLGVAKALLTTVVRDARARGRNRVGLEVDADSPTGADGLYRSLGWVEAYRTESWHADLTI